MSSRSEYIFVDLDNTLIRTDLFLESILKILKKNPFNIFKLIRWLIRSRSVAKTLVSKMVGIDPASLPYEPELIGYLEEQKALGRRIVLATAAHWRQASRIAAHLGLFDGVIASNAKTNLKGRRKLAAIREYAGGAEFAYAGDSAADRPIWEGAASAIFVNAPSRDVEDARSRGKNEKVIETRKPVARAFVKEMRLHQWAKNGLIVVPLLTSHEYFESAALWNIAVAILAFSLCASGVYFLNDLLDLDADRRHPKKRFRPLASCELSIPAGIVGAMALPLASAILAALFLPLAFLGVLGIYYLVTNAYSFFIKRISTADVMTLAVLYTLRVIAGAAAIGVELTSWLMAFSIFMFVSLAYLKRYIEVAALDRDHGQAHGRGYSAVDSETMFALGISNATASVVVLALYISSDQITRLYPGSEILWLLCFLLLYWSNRIWVGARRGKINDDPVVFAIKDRVSQMIGVAFVAVVLAARYVQI